MSNSNELAQEGWKEGEVVLKMYFVNVSKCRRALFEQDIQTATDKIICKMMGVPCKKSR